MRRAAALVAGTLALVGVAVSGCTASRPAVAPFRIVLDSTTAQGIAPRRVVSVGPREAVVEGAIGAVVLTPTGAPLPPSYTLTLVVSASAATLEGLTVEADDWRLETAYGRSERVVEGAWASAQVAGATVTVAPAGPGRMRVVLPEAVLRRLSAATRVARIAWVDAYRR